DVSHASHPKAKDLAEQAVKLWGSNAKAKLEEAIAKHADDADPAAQRKAMAGLAHHHDIGDFDLGKEFVEPAKEEPKQAKETSIEGDVKTRFNEFLAK